MSKAAVAALTLLWLVAASTARAQVRASSGDASIAQDSGAGTWTLASGGSTLTLAADDRRDFEVVRLTGPAARSWTGGAPDTFVIVDGRTLPFGRRSSGFTFVTARTTAADARLQLDLVYELRAQSLRVTRHYAVAAGAPVFEAWTSLSSTRVGGTVVADLNAFQVLVPPGTLRWLGGLHPIPTEAGEEPAFTLHQQAIEVDTGFSIGSTTRSSEQAVPWFQVEGDGDSFFGALLWSGAWSLSGHRSAAGLSLTLGLSEMSTTVEATEIDAPHAVFGVVSGGVPGVSAALRSYIVQGIRGGIGFNPLVTYNTWFAYGTRVDEERVRDELERMAKIGAERFVLDAGWYPEGDRSDYFDFESGLGVWTPDPARFPEGLRPLSEYAHALGLQFGLWVEPERVSLVALEAAGVDEAWLARQNDQYGSDRVGQICFASAAARQLIIDRLSQLISEVQPDYLKWDNNQWLNCDREGHGHGPTDGNFAHVAGLYDVLRTLRERYPQLVIENVSGGGNRLDLGMLRYSDVGWMDDRSAPSAHVRHNAQGLGVVFPPAYLLSFVMDHEAEPLRFAADMPLYVRSRMGGVLGLCFKTADLIGSDVGDIAREIAIYKSLRHLIAGASSALLSAQAAGGPEWDAVQLTSGFQVVIAAIRGKDAPDSFRVHPIGLDPIAGYEVISVDAGVVGHATGEELMTGGIDLYASPISAAHLLVISPWAKPESEGGPTRAGPR